MRTRRDMKTLSTKLFLLILVAISAAACNEHVGTEKTAAPQQSVMVTAANETAAMARLRSLGVAEAQYMADSGGSYGTLEQLIEKRFAGDPSRGKLTGYRF